MSKGLDSNEATSSKNVTNYGSISSPYLDKISTQYRSDTQINYETDHNHADKEDETYQTKIIIASTCCKSSYIIEPVAFIQNLAASIMNFSLGLFIYNRIFTRLLEQQNHSNTTNGTNFSFLASSPNLNSFMTIRLSNSNSHLLYSYTNFTSNDCVNDNSSVKNLSNLFTPSFKMGLTPSDIDAIRTRAQEETSTLYFYCSLISALPVLVMSNILGVNCSNLGRKTLVVIYLFAITCRYVLVLVQCLYPELPDYLFYVGAGIEGLGGGSGCFYLALYCFISDLASESSRSFRITFVK
jgi:hypothetical protein